ncbi:MAG: murein biosynthesis integral membrane protein MurJ [Anaerolineae bacterium]|nr:murein biosynthesis integral membrane protein MurJ [Anaerolineae bacterium]NIN98231.1 murein biosynthesis integral membrane protein MurJ [Anaerolineae bacterium]NIQ81157.1 murein biosynthesis integral membrane protein MurJ [Anaerolineae bacterium]
MSGTISSPDEQKGPSRGDGIRAGLVLKDSAVISTFNALGIASALLVDVVVAAKYGLGAETDAFFIALTIPQLLASILGTSINPVMVPLFSATRVQAGEEENWRLFSNLINLSTIFLAVVALVGVLCSPLLMFVSAPGLEDASRQVAISLNRVLFAVVVMAGLAEIMKAMLNSQRRFAVPAAASFVQYVVVVFVILLLGGGLGIHAVAIGYVLGYVLQVLALAAAVLILGGRYYPMLNTRDPTVRQAGRLFAPLVIGDGLNQSSIWIERLLASFLPAGSVSALVYARRVLRVLTQALVNSVSRALLPRLSVLASKANLKELRHATLFGIKLTFGLCVPVAVGVMVTSTQLISLLFQRQAFDEKAVSMAASILVLYMPGLAFMALQRVAVASFFASQDTKTPLYIRIGSLVLLVPLELTLFFITGVYGLPLALSLTRVVTAVAAHLLMRRRIGAFEEDLWRYGLKVGAAAIVMGLAVLPMISWMETQLPFSLPLKRVIQLGSAALVGLAIYVASLILLRVGEVEQAIRLVGSRLIARLPNTVGTHR